MWKREHNGTVRSSFTNEFETLKSEIERIAKYMEKCGGTIDVQPFLDLGIVQASALISVVYMYCTVRILLFAVCR
jgi:hypothetical protein